MKIFDSIRDYFAPQDDADDIETEREPREPARRESAAPVRESRESVRETAAPARPETTYRDQRGKVVNIQTTAQLQVVLVKPEVFTDAKQIADHLISKKTVVLNLETASAENKRRIIDFLVGVAYANGGSLKPVANLTYIITPYNVGFIGEELVNELETNGVIM